MNEPNNNSSREDFWQVLASRLESKSYFVATQWCKLISQRELKADTITDESLTTLQGKKNCLKSEAPLDQR